MINQVKNKILEKMLIILEKRPVTIDDLAKLATIRNSLKDEPDASIAITNALTEIMAMTKEQFPLAIKSEEIETSKK